MTHEPPLSRTSNIQINLDQPLTRISKNLALWIFIFFKQVLLQKSFCHWYLPKKALSSHIYPATFVFITYSIRCLFASNYVVCWLIQHDLSSTLHASSALHSTDGVPFWKYLWLTRSGDFGTVIPLPLKNVYDAASSSESSTYIAVLLHLSQYSTERNGTFSVDVHVPELE